MRATIAVLGHGVMRVQVQRNDQRAGAIGGRERQCLPAAPDQAQRGVLELRFGRRQRRSELAEHLRVGVRVSHVALQPW